MARRPGGKQTNKIPFWKVFVWQCIAFRVSKIRSNASFLNKMRHDFTVGFRAISAFFFFFLYKGLLKWNKGLTFVTAKHSLVLEHHILWGEDSCLPECTFKCWKRQCLHKKKKGLLLSEEACRSTKYIPSMQYFTESQKSVAQGFVFPTCIFLFQISL